MEIKLSVEELRKKKLFVATPMYGGNCTGTYTNSMIILSMACAKHNIDIKHFFMFNESLITRARNYCVDAFLRSDCTHLLFVDSDIGFNFRDVLTLLHLAEDDVGVIAGPYPKKTIAWENVRQAVDMGKGKDDPTELQNYVGDFVLNTIDDKPFRIDSIVEVKEAGTGFMMITRETFEKYAEAYPELRYTPDHVRNENFDGSRDITAFFDTIIDPKSKRYLSEDYMFSSYARNIGIKIYMCPWMKLKHTGTYEFSGSFSNLASLNAPNKK